MKKTKLIYPLICLLAAVIWGSSFPFQDMAGANSEVLDCFMFNSIRFFIGSVVIIPVYLLFEKEEFTDVAKRKAKQKNNIIFGSISGAVLAVAAAFQQFGIQLTSESGKAGFITGLYLIIVPVAGFILFRQKASLFVWIAIPISVVGLYFLSVQNGFKIQTGDLFVIVCAFCYAAQIIIIDRVSDRISAIRFSSIQFFVTGVICFILSLMFGHSTWEGAIVNIIPILYCGVLSAGVAFTLQTVGQKHTPPAVASILFATEGLFATVFECIFDWKLPGTKTAIGCSLMLVAILLSQIPAKNKELK